MWGSSGASKALLRAVTASRQPRHLTTSTRSSHSAFRQTSVFRFGHSQDVGVRAIGFNDVRAALAEETVHDLAGLLTLVPDHLLEQKVVSEPWPEDVLGALLSRPADQASIIRLLPVLKRFMECMPVANGAVMARRFIGRIRITRTLAALSVVVDFIIARMTAGQQNGELDFDQSMAIIDRVLNELRKFCYFTSLRDGTARSKKLPPAVNLEVVRLAKFAISLSTEQRNPSNDGQIGFAVRFRLFDSVLLSPEVREELLAHLPRDAVTSNEWRACLLSVLREGGPDVDRLAQQYAGYIGAEVRDQSPSGTDHGRPQLAFGGAPSRPSWFPSDRPGDRLALEEMDRIILARCGTPSNTLIETVAPYLYPHEQTAKDESHPLGRSEGASEDARLPSTRYYAWSMVADRLAKSPHIDSSDLRDVFEGLVDGMLVPQVITPIIQGLMRRGDLRVAWDLFTDLQKRQQACSTPGQYVDRTLLAVVTPLAAELFGFEAAPQLVDKWARRMQSPSSSQRSIAIDTVNLNALLRVCLRCHQTNTAFRLLHAAQPRWGVWPDATSLNIVLDCCRRAAHHHRDGEKDTLQSRLYEFAQDMHLFGSVSADREAESSFRRLDTTFDLAGFARGDYRVLLDKPDSDWRKSIGARSPLVLGRQLFRSVILGNWPHLAAVKSPLDSSNPFIQLSKILRSTIPPIASGEIRGPSPSAEYAHIIPNAASFQSYFKLLAMQNLQDEIPIALAWMREMGIEPNWPSMCSALVYVGEIEGPRRWVRKWHEGRAALVRDEEIMRRWLEHWVKGPVPTEDEVAAFIRQIMEKRARSRAREDV